MHAIGKITSKGQTTIPAAIRDQLHASPGDSLVWEMQNDGSARVRRVNPLDVECLKAVRQALDEQQAEDEFLELEGIHLAATGCRPCP